MHKMKCRHNLRRGIWGHSPSGGSGGNAPRIILTVTKIQHHKALNLYSEDYHKWKMYERNIPGNIQRIKFQSSCKHMQPSCPAT